MIMNQESLNSVCKVRNIKNRAQGPSLKVFTVDHLNAALFKFYARTEKEFRL